MVKAVKESKGRVKKGQPPSAGKPNLPKLNDPGREAKQSDAVERMFFVAGRQRGLKHRAPASALSQKFSGPVIGSALVFFTKRLNRRDKRVHLMRRGTDKAFVLGENLLQFLFPEADPLIAGQSQ